MIEVKFVKQVNKSASTVKIDDGKKATLDRYMDERIIRQVEMSTVKQVGINTVGRDEYQ